MAQALEVFHDIAARAQPTVVLVESVFAASAVAESLVAELGMRRSWWCESRRGQRRRRRRWRRRLGGSGS